jgi:hypothetical protein
MKNLVYKVETIEQLHKIAGMEKPRHPLISVIDYSKVNVKDVPDSGSFGCSFYTVNYKKHCSFLYGRQKFDHEEGTLHCTAPEQLITFDRHQEEGSTEGWGLYFHPELIRSSALGDKIKEYGFFRYGVNEALHLSDQEKNTLLSILKQLQKEYHTNIDLYSNELIISNIELLLNYCKRFYGRQFITRTNQNKDIISRFETFITTCRIKQKTCWQILSSASQKSHMNLALSMLKTSVNFLRKKQASRPPCSGRVKT